MKRIVLFLATNLAVVLAMSLTLHLFGIEGFLTANGLDTGSLLVFSLLAGFAGSISSLLMSKTLAKLATAAHVIALFRRDEDDVPGGAGPGYCLTVLACEIPFGLVATMIVAWFSRRREFGADAGSAHLLGTPSPMIAALPRLAEQEPGALPQSLRTFGITDRPAWLGLFASHPPLHERIPALQATEHGEVRASPS